MKRVCLEIKSSARKSEGLFCVSSFPSGPLQVSIEVFTANVLRSKGKHHATQMQGARERESASESWPSAIEAQKGLQSIIHDFDQSCD